MDPRKADNQIAFLTITVIVLICVVAWGWYYYQGVVALKNRQLTNDLSLESSLRNDKSKLLEENDSLFKSNDSLRRENVSIRVNGSYNKITNIDTAGTLIFR